MTYSAGAPGTEYQGRRSNTASITAMVLGVSSITIGVCLWFVPVLPILAIAFGHVGLRRSTSTQSGGRTQAMTGLITGYIGLGISVILLSLAIIGTFTAPAPAF